jgi:phosphoadenosine phosphosulfate reductase
MSDAFPDYIDVDYREGENQSAKDYKNIEDKLEKAIQVVSLGLNQYKNPGIMWTGGKDSTLVLYVAMEVAKEEGKDIPPVIFIDHFAHFSDVIEFVEKWTNKWGLELIKVGNEDIFRLWKKNGDEIKVTDLSESNQKELLKLEYKEDTIVVDPDSFVGNHLLKTAVLNNTITKNKFDGVFSGVRWDEQEARANETFFSPRHDLLKYPAHDRIHPILQFDERSVWDAMWKYVVPDSVKGYPSGHIPLNFEDFPEGIYPTDIPVGPKYFEGFRSLGTEKGSAKTEDKPAWLQNLEETSERHGRAQDKEGIMKRLRDLGYM